MLSRRFTDSTTVWRLASGDGSFDLLHVHEGRSAQTAALRNLLSGTPFLVTRRIPQAPSAGALRCYRRASRVVSVSDAIAEGLRKLDGSLRLLTVHDCVPALHADPGAAEEFRGGARWVIGQVGELHDAHKGQLLTLEVARQLIRTHPGVSFRLLGQGRDEALLRQEAATLANVEFSGWIDNVANVYAAMDVLVYPSRYEGLGSAILEAMSFGVPVVAAAVGGIPEIVTDGVNGLLFEAGNTSQFGDRLRSLLDDEPLRLRLGAGAREQAARYSAAAMARDYRAIYEEIAGEES